jgi:hypothetical protein
MEIVGHMSDEQRREMLLESDQQALQPVLDGLPKAAREAAERDELLWDRQREAIWSRIRQHEKQQRRLAGVLTLATTAAMLMVSTYLVSRRAAPPAPAHARQQTVDPDQELLMAVEDAVRNGGPAALEPAALLAEEINRHAKPIARPALHREERSNAN